MAIMYSFFGQYWTEEMLLLFEEEESSQTRQHRQYSSNECNKNKQIKKSITVKRLKIKKMAKVPKKPIKQTEQRLTTKTSKSKPQRKKIQIIAYSPKLDTYSQINMHTYMNLYKYSDIQCIKNFQEQKLMSLSSKIYIALFSNFQYSIYCDQRLLSLTTFFQRQYILHQLKKYSVCILITMKNTYSSLCLVLLLLSVVFAQIIQEPAPNASLSEKRAYLLSLINQQRALQATNKNINIPALYFDNALNNLAQQHTVDMIRRGYFGHINPEGLDPQQRATAAGFRYPVGQNIAYEYSLTKIHIVLRNSYEHYANTVNPYWSRAGVGIFSSGDIIFVTILFSVRDVVLYPFKSIEIKPIVDQISAYIEKYNYFLKKGRIQKLSKHISDWLSGGASTSYGSIFDYLKFVGYPKKSVALPPMTAQMIEIPYTADIMESISTQKYFITQYSAFKKYGVGVYVNNEGTVTIVVIFSTE